MTAAAYVASRIAEAFDAVEAWPAGPVCTHGEDEGVSVAAIIVATTPLVFDEREALERAAVGLDDDESTAACAMLEALGVDAGTSG